MGWIRVQLNAEQRHTLEHCFKTAPEPRLRNRCQAVLMAARGRKKQDIAADLCVSRDTVTAWLKAYRRGGVAGLTITWAPGRQRLIEERHAPMILEWVKHGPLGCGLDRANWTFAELAHHFYQTQGIRVSEWTMRAFCRRHDVYPYRPGYQYLRADAATQQQARAELAALKKRPKLVPSCC